MIVGTKVESEGFIAVISNRQLFQRIPNLVNLPHTLYQL